METPLNICDSNVVVVVALTGRAFLGRLILSALLKGISSHSYSRVAFRERSMNLLVCPMEYENMLHLHHSYSV